VTDISDRKEMEQRLKESEERYYSVFENTGTATVIIEEDTTISLANSEFERLSGYSKEEIEGKMSWTAFVLKEDLEMMRKYHFRRREDGKDLPTEYEFRFVDREGNIKEIFNKVSMIPGTKKSVASLMDITHLKETEKALRESEEKLIKMNRELEKGLSEVFEALKRIASGDPTVRITETSEINIIVKLKQMVNLTAENLKEIVDLSHEFAIGLAEHFDVLLRFSRGELTARVSGTSQVELLKSLKKITNQMLESVSKEINERKRAEEALRDSEEQYRVLLKHPPRASSQ
jgi:PAS domain S-box-containing protein